MTYTSAATAYYPPKPDLDELERENMALKKENASLRAEVFRLRNQRKH